MTISFITISSTTVTPTTAYLGDTVTLTAEVSETIPISHLAMWIIDFDETTDSSTTIFELINQGRVITNEWSAFALKTSMSSEVQIDENMLEAHTLTFILAQGGSTEISISDSPELFTIGDPINVSFKLHLYDKVKKLGNQWFYLKEELDNMFNSVIQKSNTVGLVKNDGTVDTTAYSTFDGNYNNLTNKPSIPSASSTVPSADTTSGSVGTGTAWARSDHTHPKSSLYAESIHAHSIEDTDLFDVLQCVIDNFDNFGDNILYAPLLDGTETVYTIPYEASGTSINFQPTISNNQLKDGAGYLSDGWDNTVNWELTFEYYTTGDNNGYTVIPLGTDKRDYNGIQQWYNRQLNFYVNGNKPTGYLDNASLGLNTWISVRITKEDYVWKVYCDDILKTTFDLSSYSSIVDDWTTMCIGVDRNYNRNSAIIRNILVKEI